MENEATRKKKVGRPTTLTPEQQREKRRAYQREYSKKYQALWYANNPDKYQAHLDYNNNKYQEYKQLKARYDREKIHVSVSTVD